MCVQPLNGSFISRLKTLNATVVRFVYRTGLRDVMGHSLGATDPFKAASQARSARCGLLLHVSHVAWLVYSGTAVSCESQAIRFGGGKQLWVQTEPLRYTETVQIGATWPVRLNEMPGD